MAAQQAGILQRLKARLVTPLVRVLDDRLTATQFVLLLLLVIVFVYNTASNLFIEHPLAGLIMTSLVPVLFILGGINFILIIIRSRDKPR